MSLLNATGPWTAAALSSTANFCSGSKGELEISHREREVLRALAEKVAEVAAAAPQREKRELWRKHNDLEPARPLVFCDPENGWNEIITEERLRCAGRLARRWEIVLRKELFWAEQMKDDKVSEPFFDIGYTRSEDDWGVQACQSGGHGGAYAWEPALKDEDDIRHLHAPVFAVDHETTEATLALARATFGDLLQVRLSGVWWWGLGLVHDLALLRGLETMMIDMVERPELIHRLMTLLRDGYLKKLDYLEAGGLLSSNTDSYVGSGGFGYTGQLPARGQEVGARTSDMWGFCESQVAVGISPHMFAEFVFPYQLPFLQRFGLNCYGCCEPLDSRWEVVKQAPHLRRVSVSAWADVRKMASFLEDKYILSWKPSPADLAGPALNETAIRKKIREALAITRGCRVEIIMKDNHTIGNNPQNVVRWVQIAREESIRSLA